MTPKERVHAALSRKPVDRVPVFMWFHPETAARFGRLLEIPAAILATAAVMNAGAVLARPTVGKTVGEVWLEALADWAKVMVGVVIPALLVAAAIEVWVTPQIAFFVISHF